MCVQNRVQINYRKNIEKYIYSYYSRTWVYQHKTVVYRTALLITIIDIKLCRYVDIWSQCRYTDM